MLIIKEIVCCFVQCLLVMSRIREHLTRESDSISLAKDFLRKQKHSIRERQANLQAARQEWSHDMLEQQLGVRLDNNLLCGPYVTFFNWTHPIPY